MPDKIDLTFVPVDDLIKEIESRCGEFICAFTPNDFEKDQETKFYYGKGSHHVSCGLSAVLHNDVMNNWNGELITLQRLNKDELDNEPD